MIRGVALLVILVDHLESLAGIKIFRRATLNQFGLSDALEIFVFVSGYVFGLTYLKRVKRGFALAQKKALFRCGQLVLANVATLLMVWLVILLTRPGNDRLQQMNLELLVAAPPTAVIETLLCQYQPYCLDILPLYVGILTLAPVQVWLLTRQPMLALWVTLNLYGLGQAGVNLDQYGWFYNPFSWQLLFFGGIFSSHINHAIRQRIFSASVVVFAAIAFLALTMSADTLLRDINAMTSIQLFSKSNAGLFRLIHFFLLAIPVTWCLTRFAWLSENFVARMIAACGKNSLSVFCAGVVLTYLGNFIVPRNSVPHLVSYQCLCLVSLILLPHLLQICRTLIPVLSPVD